MYVSDSLFSLQKYLTIIHSNKNTTPFLLFLLKSLWCKYCCFINLVYYLHCLFYSSGYSTWKFSNKSSSSQIQTSGSSRLLWNQLSNCLLIQLLYPLGLTFLFWLFSDLPVYIFVLSFIYLTAMNISRTATLISSLKSLWRFVNFGGQLRFCFHPSNVVVSLFYYASAKGEPWLERILK